MSISGENAKVRAHAGDLCALLHSEIGQLDDTRDVEGLGKVET